MCFVSGAMRGLIKLIKLSGIQCTNNKPILCRFIVNKHIYKMHAFYGLNLILQLLRTFYMYLYDEMNPTVAWFVSYGIYVAHNVLQNSSQYSRLKDQY